MYTEVVKISKIGKIIYAFSDKRIIIFYSVRLITIYTLNLSIFKRV